MALKIVHIAWQYGCCNTGGAAIAATRLHLALLERGIDSHYLCLRQCESGTNVHRLFDYAKWFERLYSFPKIKALWYYFGLPMPAFGKIIKEIMPDVVHVHWLNNGGPSLGQIARVKRKIVVNLHDAWILTANSPVPMKDIRFIDGYNNNNSSLVERFLFNRKAKFFRRVRPLVIGPSNWICDVAQKSIVARNCITKVISNIMDPLYFRPKAQIVHSKFTIIFGCYGGSKNRGKGFLELLSAINLLDSQIRSEIEVLVFGEAGDTVCINGFKIRYAGVISSAQGMKNVYAQGDIFAFPSVSETQGMTKVEAMLCGLPVVAFKRTACAEGITHGHTGWIANDGDIVGYSLGIAHYYKRYKSGGIEHVRSIVQREARKRFSINKITTEMICMYASLNEKGYSI